MDLSTITEMRAIWERSLHMTDLSLDDNFFDVGGHSLSMVVVQDRITERFGVEIGMDQLFRNGLQIGNPQGRIVQFDGVELVRINARSMCVAHHKL